MSPIVKVLTCATVLAAPLSAAYNGCKVADINGDGRVNARDVHAVDVAQGQPDYRMDLDGNGIVGPEDLVMVNSFRGSDCSLACPADLNRDKIVDEDDHRMIEMAFATDCRQDLDRDGYVDMGGKTNDDDSRMLVEYGGGVSLYSAESRADFDNDFYVDGTDLDTLEAAVGRDCRADLNKDGQVDVTDFWVLLASWGNCP